MIILTKRKLIEKEKDMILKNGQKRLLKAEEIECRQSSWNKEKTRYSVLLYKTARTDMDILDEVFGRDNWKTTHYEVKGKDFCMIEVRTRFEDEGFDGVGKNIHYEWVGKSDCGKDFQRVAESDEKKGVNEFEKSESSDAFKRAGFAWGIGRELYSAPDIWLDRSIWAGDLSVQEIEYDDNDKICKLILSAKGEIVYTFPERRGNNFTKKENAPQVTKPQEQKKVPDHEELEKIRDIVQKLEFEGKNLDDILKYYNVKTIGEIPLPLWEKMLAKVRGDK